MRFNLSRFLLLALMAFPCFSQAEWVAYGGFSFQEVTFSEQKERLQKFRPSPQRDKLIRQIETATPQIQKALLIRDHLVRIVTAYAESHETSQNKHFVDVVNKLFFGEYPSSSIVDAYHIFFEFDEDQFLVDGIKSTRLAVNTGREIIFNATALGAKSQSLSDLTMIWLHEILHTDNDTPLADRDAWAGQVAAWVSEQTVEVEPKSGEKVTLLMLPLSPDKKITINYEESLFAQHIIELKKNALILHENPVGTRLMNEAYARFQTFENEIKTKVPPWTNVRYENLLNIPEIQVLGMKVVAGGRLQFEFAQSTVLYQRNADGDFELYKGGPVYFYKDVSTEPRFPTTRYRLELDPALNSFDIQRVYSTPLQDGDFEINHVHDVKDKRFVSLRLNIPDSLQVLKSSASVHLIAKEQTQQRPISVTLLGQRYLSKDEVLLHFEVPQGNLEIQRLLLPNVDSDGKYTELILRPSKPLRLAGPNILSATNLEVASLDISTKKTSDDPTMANLQVVSAKKVIAVTLDIEHRLTAVRIDWQGSTPQRKSEPLATLAQGRKYFFDGKALRRTRVNGAQHLTFEIPKAVMTQTGRGPEIRTVISWFYDVTSRPWVETMRDTFRRRITAGWLHFEDGTIERLQDAALPKPFSLLLPPQTQPEEHSPNKSAKTSEAKTCDDLL